MLKPTLQHYLRLDARALGLFRITFGILLCWDLLRRWTWLDAFYSNQGVLPNHNHLFNLRDKVEVFSIYHAFSSPGEAWFAFFVTLLFYIAFTVGWRTRAFHALSLVCLVSLSARNILAENAGNYLTIALAAFSLFLPLGSRFSIDSIRRRMSWPEEKDHHALNDRTGPDDAAVQRRRLPGWSPVSLAAFALIAQIALVFLVGSLQQGAAWKDGTALSRALYLQAWVTDWGVALRGGGDGLLSVATRLLHWSGYAIPALLFLPVLRGPARLVAVVLVLVHGLVLGLLFDLGLYPWALVACAPLLVPTELWDKLASRHRHRLARTVIYDADCGICLWLSRLLKRLDAYEHLTFQGNDVTDALLVRDVGDEVRRTGFPSMLSAERLDETVATVDRDGQVALRGRALAEVVHALPVVGVLYYVMRAPGVSHLLDWLYDIVATRRIAISVDLGFAACGLPVPVEDADGEPADASELELPPSTRLRRRIMGGLRELLVATVFVAMLAQTGQANAIPEGMKLPQGELLAAVARWPRMLATWDVLTPEPATEQGMLVVDAVTRGRRGVDLMTGRAIQLDVTAGPRLGQLWADYSSEIQDSETRSGFHNAFRDYLARTGGPGWDSKADADSGVVGFDAYWVKGAVGPADGTAADPKHRRRLFRYSQGGSLGGGPLQAPSERPTPGR